jgi:hypothetical protein
MKKIVFIVLLMLFSISPILSFARDSKSRTEVVIKDDKLTSEQIEVLEKRVETLRNMDKSEMTTIEKREARSELKSIKENVRKDGGVIYISGGVLVLLIILIILL